MKSTLIFHNFIYRPLGILSRGFHFWKKLTFIIKYIIIKIGTMVNLIIWILISFGMSNIVVYSTLFIKLREYVTERSNFFGQLINCIMCFSFWSGVILSLVYSPSNALFFANSTSILLVPLKLFLDGLLSSGSVYFINSIVEKLEK